MTDIFTQPDPVDTETSYTLDSYVGEGKRYKTPEDFVKSRIEADRFIETLKAEKRAVEQEKLRLQEELNAQKRLEEIADRLLQNKTDPQVPPVTNQGERDTGKEVTPEAIQEMIRKTLLEGQTKAQQENNKAAVVQALKQSLGNNYPEKLRARLEELGVGEQEANQIAASNPKAFLAMVTPQTRMETPDITAPRSVLNSDFKPSPSGKTWSYYEAMRTSPDPKVRDRYWSQTTQNEIHKSAASFNNPEDFYK